MISSPPPRLVAAPGTAGVGAQPVTVAVGSPIGINAGRSPAASVGPDNHPLPVRAQGLIEIVLCSDHHVRGFTLCHWRRHIHFTGWWWLIIPICSRLFYVGCTARQHPDERTEQYPSDSIDEAFHSIHGVLLYACVHGMLLNSQRTWTSSGIAFMA